eukprot:scaffold21169_cov125-Isochrysis_galbana.AAC.3
MSPPVACRRAAPRCGPDLVCVGCRLQAGEEHGTRAPVWLDRRSSCSLHTACSLQHTNQPSQPPAARESRWRPLTPGRHSLCRGVPVSPSNGLDRVSCAPSFHSAFMLRC